jgi:hypothetical protein
MKLDCASMREAYLEAVAPLLCKPSGLHANWVAMRFQHLAQNLDAKVAAIASVE